MAGRIFINYRRGDDPGFAGRLFDRLEAGFTSDQLFMDVDSIAPGYDFVRVLEEHVDKCDVLLAIIGRGWLDARDEAGRRRLDNADDFVRIEIESGLKLGKRVIPVLVNGAEMPRAEVLPEPLKPLSRRNAVRLTHDRFKSDAQGLIKVLQEALEEAQAASEGAAATQHRRQEEEAAEAEEQAARDKERARLQAIAGLSPEQIAKAEELANWDFIKESQNPQDFRDHLARFPGGVVERNARVRLEGLVWAGLGKEPDIETLKGFLDEFPFGAHAMQAKAQSDAMQQKAEADRLSDERARANAATKGPERIWTPLSTLTVIGLVASGALWVGWSKYHPPPDRFTIFRPGETWSPKFAPSIAWFTPNGSPSGPIEGNLLLEFSDFSVQGCTARCRDYTNCSGVSYAITRCTLWGAKPGRN